MDNTAVPRKRSLKNPPLRIDFTAMGRRSLDMSPSRSSVQSSQIHTPSSSVPSTPLVLTRAPSPDKCPLRPRDSSTFLTALATEERRVLELKEELQKAEGELEKLKKQWASHEAAKKKNELRHLEQLQPLQPSSAGTGLSDDNESRITPRDLDRRQMAPFPVKNPQRTVFSGSRHARTLSLLSPKDSPTDLSVSSRGLRPPRGNRNDGGIIKAKATTHELSISTDGINDSDQPYRGPPKDMILETGKQLVGDFRQGLWTFFEDLKQVTVGDEAAGVSDPRCQHTFSAENLPKTQARRKGGSIVKKSPARKGKRLDLESSARHPKTESFLIHEPSNRLNVTPTIVSAVPTSLDNTSIGNTNCNSSDSDDDDCTFHLQSSSLKHVISTL